MTETTQTVKMDKHSYVVITKGVCKRTYRLRQDGSVASLIKNDREILAQAAIDSGIFGK